MPSCDAMVLKRSQKESASVCAGNVAVLSPTVSLAVVDRLFCAC